MLCIAKGLVCQSAHIAKFLATSDLVSCLHQALKTGSYRRYTGFPFAGENLRWDTTAARKVRRPQQQSSDRLWPQRYRAQQFDLITNAGRLLKLQLTGMLVHLLFHCADLLGRS